LKEATRPGRVEVLIANQDESLDNRTQLTQIAKSLVFYGCLFQFAIHDVRQYGGACNQVRAHGDHGRDSDRGVNGLPREDEELCHDVCGRSLSDGGQYVSDRESDHHAHGRGGVQYQYDHASGHGDGVRHGLKLRTRS
jgi:hypothetical protein